MAFCLLLIVFFIKPKSPEYYGMLPDGAELGEELNKTDEVVTKGIDYASSVQEEEFTLREAIRTQAFWLILVASMGQSMAFYAISIHTIPFLTDRGIDATTAGFMMSLLVFFTAPSRLLVGILADKLGKGTLPYVLAGFYFLQSLGIAVFLFHPSLMTIYVFLVLFGFGNGAPGTLGILLRGRYFGRKSYGSISGIASVVTAPVGLIAPIYAGWIYDTTGSYTFAFSSFAVITLVAAVLAMCVRPPKKASPV